MTFNILIMTWEPKMLIFQKEIHLLIQPSRGRPGLGGIMGPQRCAGHSSCLEVLRVYWEKSDKCAKGFFKSSKWTNLLKNQPNLKRGAAKKLRNWRKEKTLGFSGTGSTLSQVLKAKEESELVTGGQGIHEGPETAGERQAIKNKSANIQMFSHKCILMSIQG